MLSLNKRIDPRQNLGDGSGVSGLKRHFLGISARDCIRIGKITVSHGGSSGGATYAPVGCIVLKKPRHNLSDGIENVSLAVASGVCRIRTLDGDERFKFQTIASERNTKVDAD
jgi:hypothetical protein